MGSGGGFARQADSFLDEGIKGQWYATGRGPVSVAGGGLTSGRFNVVNPVGSGKLIMIHRYRVHVTTASEFIEIRVNATTNLPTFALPATNRRVGGPAGVAQIFQDTGPAMTGGIALPYQIPVATSANTFTEFLIVPTIIVPPGFSIGTNFQNTTGGASNWITLLDWKEVPA